MAAGVTHSRGAEMLMVGDTGLSVIRRIHQQNTSGLVSWMTFCESATLPPEVELRVDTEASTGLRLEYDSENAKGLAINVVDRSEVTRELRGLQVATSVAIKKVLAAVFALELSYTDVVFDETNISNGQSGERFITLMTRDPRLNSQRREVLEALASLAPRRVIEWPNRPADMTVAYVPPSISEGACRTVRKKVHRLLPLTFDVAEAHISPTLKE